MSKPGFCSNGIDVELMRRKDRGQTRDDAGLVLHQKTQIPRRLKVAAYLGRRELKRVVGARSRCEGFFRHKGPSKVWKLPQPPVGSPPAPAPKKAMRLRRILPKSKPDSDFLCTRPEGGGRGKSSGWGQRRQITWSLSNQSARNLTDGAAQLGGVIEIDRIDGANGAGANVFRRNAYVQTRQRENGKFRAGIAAVEILAGVGFGIAAGLRFLQEPSLERYAIGFNARVAENVGCTYRSEFPQCRADDLRLNRCAARAERERRRRQMRQTRAGSRAHWRAAASRARDARSVACWP